MRKSPGLYSLTKHSVFAVVLTTLTGVFGAPFMRIIRQTHGPMRFWLVALFTTAVASLTGGFWASLCLGACWMVVGLYCELESRGAKWQIAGTLSLFITAGVGAFLAQQELVHSGVKSWPTFVSLVKEKLAVLDSYGMSKVEPDMLAAQMPSGAVILLVLCLALSIILEKRVYRWFHVPRERVVSQLKPLEFRLPDLWQWVTLIAFLFSFVDFGSKALQVLGTNILNVSVVLYFFQGLAILEVLLNSLRLGVIPRAVAYVLLIGQLFFVLSAVGFLDFWIDFRGRLKKFVSKAGSDSHYGGPV